MTRIADMLYKNGSLKVNSVNALAKAACFTQINIYLGYEGKEKAFQEPHSSSYLLRSRPQVSLPKNL
jgi:hypothetical protein